MAKPIKKTKKLSASKKTAVTKKKVVALKTKRSLTKQTVKKPVKKTTKRLLIKKVKTNTKRNIIITVALACCALAAVIILTSGNGFAYDNNDGDVLNISISRPKCSAAILGDLYIGTGKYGMITSLINPYLNRSFSWTSSDPSALLVVRSKADPYDGAIVYGMKPGQAVITVSSSSGCYQQITKTVKEDPKKPFGTRITKGVKSTTTKGNITIYEENGCNSDTVYQFKKELGYLPNQNKYFNYLYFLTSDSFKTKYLGSTVIDRIYVNCTVDYSLTVLSHESMHAFDNAWYIYRGINLTDRDDFKNLYETYRKLYDAGKGFPKSDYHDYAMTDTSEFWATMYQKYFLKKNINNNNIKTASQRKAIFLPDDVSSMISKYVKEITEFKNSDLYTIKTP